MYQKISQSTFYKKFFDTKIQLYWCLSQYQDYTKIVTIDLNNILSIWDINSSTWDSVHILKING